MLYSNIQKYENAATTILPGDLLLYRGRRLSSFMIRRGGRSVYSHAAMAFRKAGEVRCAQMLGGRGGVETSLYDEVVANPVRWDVFRPNAGNRFACDIPQAIAVMQQFIGRDYGWAHLLKVACLHLPMVRLLLNPDMDDIASDRDPPFCSEAVCTAYRLAGCDPVPNLSDRLTEPGDLARSLFFQYVCTLIP